MGKGLGILGILCACVAICGFGQAAAESESKEKSAAAPKQGIPAANKPGRMTITRDGSSRATSFRSIQEAVEALQPGDILTIGTGEYYENVKVSGLGDLSKETIIRAEVPGTVVLRGDVPAPEFRKVEGYHFVYAAPFDRKPNAIIEHNTMHTFASRANVAELEFDPGYLHYDADARMLYISNPGLDSPDQYRYTVSVNKNCGFELNSPKRVTIDGLAAT